MAVSLPRFCPILDRSLRPDLSLQVMAGILADADVRWTQLRSKAAPSRQLLSDARQLVSLLPDTCRLIVNDRCDIALLAGAAGVHLGQDDLPVLAARYLIGPGIIGFSTHTREQVGAANSLPVDYVAIGPIFPTSTKADAAAVLGLQTLRELRSLTDKPVMAIGGITAANAPAVIEAGADSVAVISAWLSGSDILARIEEFRESLGRLD